MIGRLQPSGRASSTLTDPQRHSYAIQGCAPLAAAQEPCRQRGRIAGRRCNPANGRLRRTGVTPRRSRRSRRTDEISAQVAVFRRGSGSSNTLAASASGRARRTFFERNGRRTPGPFWYPIRYQTRRHGTGSEEIEHRIATRALVPIDRGEQSGRGSTRELSASELTLRALAFGANGSPYPLLSTRIRERVFRIFSVRKPSDICLALNRLVSRFDFDRS